MTRWTGVGVLITLLAPTLVFAAPPLWLTETARLTYATNYVPGQAVALSGDIAAVGWQNDTKVNVHYRNAAGLNQWGLVQTITTPDGDHSFGSALALDGDLLVVGAHQQRVGVDDTGAAYIFRRNAGGSDNWGLERRLLASDRGDGDRFGRAVAISGDTVAVGSSRGTFGSTYVSQMNHGGVGNWGEVKKIPGLSYGTFAIDLSGDVLVAGASGRLNSSDPGIAHVYGRDQGGSDQWGLVTALSASLPESDFGAAVAVNGTTIAVTDSGARTLQGQPNGTGVLYLFDRDEGGAGQWGETAHFSAFDAAHDQAFGASVDLWGPRVVVGAPGDSTVAHEAGAAYVFEHSAGTWAATAKLLPSSTTIAPGCGRSIALSGTTVLAGNQGGNLDPVDIPVFDLYQTGPAGELLVSGQGIEIGNGDVTPALADGTDFGAPAWGTTSTGEFAIANTGSFPIWLYGVPRVELAGPNADQFRISVQPVRQVGAATSVTLEIIFQPTEVGVFSADVQFVNSDNDENPFTFAIQGTGVPEPAPLMVVQGLGSHILSGDDTPEEADGTDFGSVQLGHSSGTHTFDILNQGNAPLVLSGSPDRVELAGSHPTDFSVVAAPSTPVGTNDMTSFGLMFTPGGEGLRTAEVRIANNDTNHQPYVFNVQGMGQGEPDVLITLATPTDLDGFGESVALEADVLLVGAPRSYGRGPGEAYVFRRDQGGPDAWGQVRPLSRTGGFIKDFDGFGKSVALSDGIALVGTPGEDSVANGAGAAFVYGRNQGGADNWGQVRMLVSSNVATRSFGTAVALDADLAAVGAPGASSGRVAFFLRDQGGAGQWGQIAEVQASDGSSSDRFGSAIALSDDEVLISGRRADYIHVAYLRGRHEGGSNHWGEITALVGDDRESGDGFGSVLALAGDTAVVGAPIEDSSRGAVFIFGRHVGGSNQWGQVVRLTAPVRDEFANFGRAVSLQGDLLAVGTPGQDYQGVVYLFGRNEGGPENWGILGQLTAQLGQSGEFGAALCFSDDRLAVGDPASDEVGWDAGAVHVVIPLPQPLPLVVGLQAIQVSQGQVVIEWQGRSGWEFSVEGVDGASPGWSLLPGMGTASGSNAPMSAVDVAPPDWRRYRVRATQP